MSKGTQVIPVRIPAELLGDMDRHIQRTADTRKEGPWTRSAFIIAAVREKLDHYKRSRDRAGRRLAVRREGAGPAGV